MTREFGPVAEKFGRERKQFEARLLEIHDRYIIVDNRAWIIGQSIKDAGNKPLAIVEFNEAGIAKSLFERL